MSDPHEVPAAIDELLEPLRRTGGVPALASAVIGGGRTTALGSVGFRKNGSPERVSKDDKWHIGSCTKSMTATLAARLVDEGKLRWDTTLAEGLPEFAAKMKPDWRDVTVEQLLANHGGAPHDLERNRLWRRIWLRVEDPPYDQREFMARELLMKQAPAEKPGSKFVYSNAGYALVGHVIETRLRVPWEEAVRDRLFHPLGMDSAGFGAPASVGRVDQPWGHLVGADGGLIPVAPGLRADNPSAIGPAGSVHCSVGDLAKYAVFHISGGDLLRPETLKKLHTATYSDSDYAFGWHVVERRWGGGAVLTHAGSNTMNYAVIWLAPGRGFAVVACTNAGGEMGVRVVDSAASALVQEFLGEG